MSECAAQVPLAMDQWADHNGYGNRPHTDRIDAQGITRTIQDGQRRVTLRVRYDFAVQDTSGIDHGKLSNGRLAADSFDIQDGHLVHTDLDRGFLGLESPEIRVVSRTPVPTSFK